MTDFERNSPQNAVINAALRILRPLIKLLINKHITFPYLSNLLKRLYLDVAIHDIPTEGVKLTDSRLSLLTGVHRKDIRRLKQEPELLQPSGEKIISLSAQVISTWLSDTDYCDDTGQPKILWRQLHESEPSFESLVEQVSKQDLRARSLLDEWLRSGTISLIDENKVQLNVESFGPAEEFDEKIFFFKRNLQQHLDASVENILSNEPPHFDRCVYMNNLSETSRNELDQYARQQAAELIKQINRKGRSLQKQDSGSDGEKYRIHFGSFFHSENQNQNNNGEKSDEK